MPSSSPETEISAAEAANIRSILAQAWLRRHHGRLTPNQNYVVSELAVELIAEALRVGGSLIAEPMMTVAVPA